MMHLEDFPALNATLNAASTVLIASGWLFIRRERKIPHIACMLAALVTSTAFLTCYLIYHFNVGSVKFTTPGMVKGIYYFILFTHVVLAIVILPMVVLTVVPALRQRFDRHRRLGRWTMPVWLYVSVTGVIVYFMLYQWFPSDELKTRFKGHTAERREGAARSS
jgi:putative membrane protein